MRKLARALAGDPPCAEEMSPHKVASFDHVGGAPPPIDVVSIVNAVLRKDQDLPHTVRRPERERKKGVVHPSEAGGCLRRVALSLGMAKEDDAPFDAQSQRVFHVGHQVHHRVQGYLRRAAELGVKDRLTAERVTDFRENLLVKYPSLLVDGELDCGIKVGGVWYIVEVKSARSTVFKALRVAKPEWEGQVDLYMLGSGARASVVVVECKDDQRLQQFFLPYDRDRLVRRARGLKRAIAAARGEGPWPAMETEFCFFCNYKTACKRYPHEETTARA